MMGQHRRTESLFYYFRLEEQTHPALESEIFDDKIAELRLRK